MKKPFGLKKVLIIASLFIIVAVGLYISSSRLVAPGDIEMGIVVRGDVHEVVSETGFVRPSREVAMAFERSGRVVSIPVSEGDVVVEGANLISLDTSERQVELATAYARLQAEQVRLNELTAGADNVSLGVAAAAVDTAEIAVENAKTNLQEVISQQDQLVANSKKTLRTSNLAAYLISDESESDLYTFTAPTISGTYNSDEEGVYRIELYNSKGVSGSSYLMTGLEAGTEQVSTINPTPIGTRGLYIQFPEDFAKRTLWEIPIPNTRSTNYLANLNAYNAAVKTRDVAIKTAETAIRSAEASLAQSQKQYTQVSSSARDERVEAQRALVMQMRAAVQSAEIALEKSSLKAPFTGIVTKVATEEGEIISPSVPVLSLISEERFELKVNISESDIQEITIGDKATVTFDAYDDATFEAEVTQIAPTATFSEGVRVFVVTLQFTNKDERVLPGLSADIDIIAAERKNVIAIPSRAVVERDDGKFVRSWDGKTLTYIPVQTGLRGSDGMTEIISGLNEGTQIITFAREETIAQLEVSN